MNFQEHSLISDLAERLEASQPGEIDAEANTLIQEKIAQQPNAVYQLTQTVLILEHSLKLAEEKMLQMNKPAEASGFLDKFLSEQNQSTKARYAETQTQDQPAYVQQSAAAPSNFLKSAATTAVGVVGGALVFEGIRDLFSHGFNHSKHTFQASDFDETNPALNDMEDDDDYSYDDNLALSDYAMDDSSDW